MKKSRFNTTLKNVYGGAKYQPSAFERRAKKRGRRLYVWGAVLLIFAAVAATALGLYLFARTPSSFTGERISIALDSANMIKTGASQPVTLVIKNNEDIDIESMEFFIRWPSDEGGKGVRYLSSKIAPRNNSNNTWALEGLKSGKEKEFSFDAFFTGSPGDTIELPVRLNVQPKGFSSSFTVNEAVVFEIGEARAALSLLGPEDVASGTELEMVVAVESLSEEESDGAFEQLMLSLEYPEQFQIIETDPARINGQWQIGDMSVGSSGRREVRVRGKVEGAVGDEIIIRAYLKKDDTLLVARSQKVITLQNTSAQVMLAAAPANGQKLQWGERLTYTLRVNNTGTYVLRDVVASVSITGDPLWRPGSIEVKNGGFFESGNVVWDAQTTPSLDSIPAGTTVSVTFSIETVSSPPQNFEDAPVLTAKGRLRSSLGDQELVSETDGIETPILANISFDASGWYTGPNGESWGSGPHDPLVGQETQYAIIWEIGPTSSELEALSARAVLPRGARWMSRTDYSVGELVFDDASNTVEWKSSRVPKLSTPIRIRFMLGITPDRQATDALLILERSRLKATDRRAGEELELFSNPVTVGSVRE